MSSTGFYSNYITTNGLNEINATDINSDSINSGIVNTSSLYVNGVQITGNSSGSATVNVGTTTTLPSGTPAYVNNSGSSTNAVLNFGIPQGQQGVQGIQGPQGAQGPQGIQGPEGISFIYRNQFVISTQYYTNDVVSFNGSSYICLSDVRYVYPDSNTTYWYYLAVKGDTGDTGPRGPKGDRGDTGPRGPKGNDGADGSSPDIGTIITAVLATAGIVALQAQITIIGTSVATLQTQMTAVQTQITIMDTEITTLDNKTLYQSTSTPASSGNNSTNFKSDVVIGTTFSDKITLSPYGLSTFEDDVNIGGKLKVSNDLNVDGNEYISESLSVVGDISQSGNHNFKSGEITGAKIEYSNILGLENKGTLGVRAGVINIGNADQTSVINLNGAVNMSLYNIMGFNSSNGFISQFS